MKKSLFIFIIALIALSSCEQVIDIDLNLAAPALVIEGKVVQDSLVRVCLQETTSYFSPDSQPCIDSAIVIVQEDDRAPDTLINKGYGQYESGTVRGKIGSTYYMTVIYDQLEYEAESYIPEAPVIYELNTAPMMNMFGDDSTSRPNFPGGMHDMDTIPYILTAKLNNDLSVDDYILAQYWVNGENMSSPFDPISDENSQDDTLTIMAMYGFYEGDTLILKTYAVDRYVHRYFDMLDDILNTNMMDSSTPYNPWSNISNNALGVFSAMGLSSDTIIVGL